MGYRVAIVGATGAVGLKMREILEEREFPVDRLRLLSSKKSAGKTLPFHGSEVKVEELTNKSFENIDIFLFSAGSVTSKIYAPIALEKNSIVIDNSSAFRLEPSVPLVVPEINPEQVKQHRGVIANPNCSTIQLVLALKPIHDKYCIKRVVVTTFQSVSGGGLRCLDELRKQTRAILNGEELEIRHFPHQIAFNVLPQIPQRDAFLPNCYSTEEMKMVSETHKILRDRKIHISPTCVRVPVFVGHSESVSMECKEDVSAKAVRELLAESPGVELLDDPSKEVYPLATNCEDKDAVFVGRIREGLFDKKHLNMWIVSDNLRKGAALNAVQIAELL